MLTSVEISNLRNLENVSCHSFGNINLLTGDNGAGKTSFLEALNILSTGRSFRTNQIANVISDNHQELLLFCKSDDGIQIGMSRNRKGDYQVKINHESVDKLSTLAKYLPLRVMTPESFLMLTAGAQARRQFIDFSVFHVEHSFARDMQNYMRLLKQRNALLKTSTNYDEIALWDKQIVPLSYSITESRERTFQDMLPHFDYFLNSFLPQYEVQYALKSGIDSNDDLSKALADNYFNDRKYGHTSLGPHKADIKIRIHNTDAHQVLSRGELKMLVTVLILGQVRWLLTHQPFCCLIIDDLTSELDIEKQQAVLEQLQIMTGLQTFITSIEIPEHIANQNNYDVKMFHVEHGNITTR